jgi:hypothetical protein
MSSPHEPSPYFTTPVAPARPRMFNSTTAKVVWILVPILTLSLGACVPFIVAANKKVIQWWLAFVYIAAEVVILGIGTAVDPKGDTPFFGLMMVFLIIASAVHTALLDNDSVTIGK